MRRLVKRFSPPGTSPGILQPPAPRAAGQRSARLLTYERAFLEEHRLNRVSDAVALILETKACWLRVFGHESEALKELGNCFSVHPLVLEDVVNVGQRPKTESYDDYLFLIVDVLRLGETGELEEEQVSLLLFEKLLISIQERESDIFATVEERLRSGKGRMRGLGVDYLAYALVDAMIDQYFPLLEKLGEQLEEVEYQLLEKPDRDSFEKLHRIKRNLLQVRKAVWPLREMVGAFARSDGDFVHEDTRVWLRDLYDHAVQIIDIVENFREMAAELVDLYLSSVSNRMNEVMKVLTIIATIFIPLTFIVGVYGMNFHTERGSLNMPELDWKWGYVTIWGVMITIALGMLWMFRRRKWL